MLFTSSAASVKFQQALVSHYPFEPAVIPTTEHLTPWTHAIYSSLREQRRQEIEGNATPDNLKISVNCKNSSTVLNGTLPLRKKASTSCS